MDKLEKVHFIDELSGQIFLAHHDAIKALCDNAFDVEMEYHL